jgi:hypothetical protein
MTQYVGLDVLLKETKLHVLDEAGYRVLVDAQPIPLRSLQQCAVRSQCGRIGSRLDH